MALRPQLEEIRSHAAATRGKALHLLYHLSPEQMSWKGPTMPWSVAQILDHLNKVHRLTAPKFEAAISGGWVAEHERDETVRPRLGDRFFTYMMGPNCPFRTPVPAIFEPEATPDPDESVSDFFAYHDDLVELLIRSDDFRLREVLVDSPINPLFKIGFIAYMKAIFRHEEYHWNQVEAVVRSAGFPR